jgi:membrane protease YdiL (CAAX protease family)
MEFNAFMEISGIYKQVSPYRQFFLLLFLLIIFIIFSTLIGLLLLVPFYGVGVIEDLSKLSDYSDPKVVAMLKFMQIVNQIGSLIIPALVFALLVDGFPARYLHAGKAPKWKHLLIVTVLIFVAMPFINQIVGWNQGMHLPRWLSHVETWMKSSEANAEKITEAFLISRSAAGLMLNMFMIAVLPAIGEEFLFRGVLTRLFGRWLNNSHAGVWIAAFLFSAIHLQFYGFVPRLLLGVAFGYLFVWTGNIWVPVAAHFINNGSSVIVEYLSGKGFISTNAETFGQSDNIAIIVASAIFCGALLLILYLERRKESLYIE